MLVQHVADEAVAEGDLGVEALEGEDASRNSSEPDSVPLRTVRMATPPESAEACHRRGSNEQEHSPGPPGWLGAARIERLVRNLGDPVRWVEPNAEGQDISRGGRREVGWARSSVEAGQRRWSEGALLIRCLQREGGEPIGLHPEHGRGETGRGPAWLA